MKISQRRRKVADLYLRGVAPEKISPQVGASLSTIYRDLRRLDHQWRGAARSDVACHFGADLHLTFLVQREAFDAWDASRRRQVTTKAVHETGGPTERTRAEHTERESPGNPRFLLVVVRCLERRAKMLGYDSPVLHELRVDAGGPVLDAGLVTSLLEKTSDSIQLEIGYGQAIAEDGAAANGGDAGPARPRGEPGDVEARPAPGPDRPGTGGHRGGPAESPDR